MAPGRRGAAGWGCPEKGPGEVPAPAHATMLARGDTYVRIRGRDAVGATRPKSAQRFAGNRGGRLRRPRPDARCSRTVMPVHGEGYVSSSARTMGTEHPQNARAAGLHNSIRVEEYRSEFRGRHIQLRLPLGFGPRSCGRGGDRGSAPASPRTPGCAGEREFLRGWATGRVGRERENRAWFNPWWHNSASCVRPVATTRESCATR